MLIKTSLSNNFIKYTVLVNCLKKYFIIKFFVKQAMNYGIYYINFKLNVI